MCYQIKILAFGSSSGFGLLLLGLNYVQSVGIVAGSGFQWNHQEDYSLGFNYGFERGLDIHRDFREVWR